MAHVLTRVNYFAYVRLGGMAWYAESLEKVAEAWLAARPDLLSLVPRVLEKAQARILEGVEKSSPLRRKLFHRNSDRARRMTRVEVGFRPDIQNRFVRHNGRVILQRSTFRSHTSRSPEHL